VDTPVLLIHFNRPETTQRQLDVLSTIRPKRIWLLCDAARPGRPEEAEKVGRVRGLLDAIPWDCEIRKCFRESNLGIFRNISSGISWFMDEAGEGIILEDDCLPSEGFFPFASEMLARYADEEQVQTVSGFTGWREPLPIQESYCFSNYFSCWGWATWKRAWDTFDPDMRGFFERDRWHRICRRLHRNPRQRLYWEVMFRRVASGRTDSWAYRRLLSIWDHNGRVVVPKENLVENIGFNEEATNTSRLAGMDVGRRTLDFPLRHPAKVEASPFFDKWTEDHCHSKSIGYRLNRLLK